MLEVSQNKFVLKLPIAINIVLGDTRQIYRAICEFAYLEAFQILFSSKSSMFFHCSSNEITKIMQNTYHLPSKTLKFSMKISSETRQNMRIRKLLDKYDVYHL